MLFTKLIIVPCHASFKAGVFLPLPCPPENEKLWTLLPFQNNEVKFYIEHINSGLGLLRKDENAVLMFSGGLTRQEAGRWTEAQTYLHTALYELSENDELNKRLFTEDYARDSFENLLFSICRFRQITGAYPKHISVAGWGFKKHRFDLHRHTLKYPFDKYEYITVNSPCNESLALEGELKTISEFKTNFYGSSGNLLIKREKRTINKEEPHPYASIPGLENYFSFIEDISNSSTLYPHILPWEIF